LNNNEYIVTKEPVQDPVISKKTGHLYEKRIIQKYLEENHKCPITGEEMTEDDLIELKTGTCKYFYKLIIIHIYI